MDLNLNKQQFSADFAGRQLTLTVSRLAEQADAAVLAQYGDTTVLATVVIGKQEVDKDYFPLVVDYEEKFYAAGKIIGSRFVRREGRPSEAAILSGRLIDRTIRPLFDDKLRREIQVVITVLSYDEENDPDFIALLAASTALSISPAPWNGPVAGVRLAKNRDGELIINPTNSFFAEDNKVLFDAFVAGTANKINMIELGGNEVKEEEIAESFAATHQEIKKIIQFQEEIVKKIGQSKIEIAAPLPNQDIKLKILNFLKDKLEGAIYAKDKIDRQNKLDGLKTALNQYLDEEAITDRKLAENILEEEIYKTIRKNILANAQRPDGRKLDEVRALYAEIGLFGRLHGSALFARGNTQALAVTTLAAPGAEQLIETMEISAKRRFMLHYNFPPYSTGEIGRLGFTGRREIGHGNLAEKALRTMLPSQDEFPYTIRVVSEILSSNGSSSMASVCASSMSLMDAGVPIKKAVAGIAMGLITDDQQPKYKILTDIQGPEDHYGDMDFKVAGTKDGVTALQTDVKIEGLTIEVIKETLAQAKKARLEILEVMNKIISEPRKQISPFAPVVISLDIDPDQIGAVIGPGGKMINSIIASTGVQTIDINQGGKVYVAAADLNKAQTAVDQIKALTRQFEVGEIVEGKVVKILDFGAIVDLGGDKDGMIHVSELKNGFVEKVEDAVKVGDVVKVKVIRVENGKIGLSLKQAINHY